MDLVINKINNLYTNKPEDSHHYVTNTVLAKADSGASGNYWRDKDKHVLANIKPDTIVSVNLPNAQPITSTLTGTIPLSNNLSTKAKQATVLPNPHSSSLISLGKLCDDDCKVLLDKKELNVCKDEKVVLKGYLNKRDSLWDIPVVNSLSRQDAQIKPM